MLAQSPAEHSQLSVARGHDEHLVHPALCTSVMSLVALLKPALCLLSNLMTAVSQKKH